MTEGQKSDEATDLWHAASPDSLLFHNAYLGKGLTLSISASAEMPGLGDAVSEYAFAHNDRGKEALWEQVRLANHSDRPSRMKATFAFLSLEEANDARDSWWKGEDKVIVRVQLLPMTRFHIADARHLDSLEAGWEAAAHRYWAGDLTDRPLKEVIIHGPLFFPDWERSPFGLLKPRTLKR